MTVTLCRPDTYPIRRILLCPVENRRRRMAGYDTLWYGATLTCLGCGDMWTEGEMHPRPFKPRWRQKNMATARQRWDAAAGSTPAGRRAWLTEQMAGVAS